MSDCLISISCSKCREKTDLFSTSPLDMFRFKIFVDPDELDQNSYPVLLDWFSKKDFLENFSQINFNIAADIKCLRCGARDRAEQRIMV